MSGARLSKPAKGGNARDTDASSRHLAVAIRDRAVFLLATVILCMVADVTAETMVQIYPGKLLRTERLSSEQSRYLEAKFIGIRDNNLAFEILEFERVLITELPIYEKVKVTRQRNNNDDRGVREPIAGEFIEGEPEEREEIHDVGPASNVAFTVLDHPYTANENGIVIDTDQIILEQFEDRKVRGLSLMFANAELGLCVTELSRTELYEHFGIDFSSTRPSHPEHISLQGEWDRESYAPGDTARLTVHVGNTSASLGIYRVLGMSMSRWPWLDSRIFYVGNVQPSLTQTFTRIFRVPGTASAGRYYLRVGFNDYSGSKPQLPLSIVVTEN